MDPLERQESLLPGDRNSVEQRRDEYRHLLGAMLERLAEIHTRQIRMIEEGRIDEVEAVVMDVLATHVAARETRAVITWLDLLAEAQEAEANLRMTEVRDYQQRFSSDIFETPESS